MADDDKRDKFYPKHLTPPIGMPATKRAATSPGIPIPQQYPATPAYPPFVSDTPTPVDMPLPGQIERASGYAREARTTTIDIQRRVGELEKSQTAQLVQLGTLATQVVSLDTKVDMLVDESKESRRERLDRERAAEKLATDELAFRRERSLKIIAVLVPLIAALGTLFAGLAGAFR